MMHNLINRLRWRILWEIRRIGALGAFARQWIDAIRHPRTLWYLLTPTPALSNVGDHAQAVAIRKWMQQHFSDWGIIELDKDQVPAIWWLLRLLLRKQDAVLLHSGGNMSGRAPWTEGLRRRIVATFTSVPVVSLPQTISFSENPAGSQERLLSTTAYEQHPHFLLVARDSVSRKQADVVAPSAGKRTCPDFVLMLQNGIRKPPKNDKYILLCLRRDDERAFETNAGAQLQQFLHERSVITDTTLDFPIRSSQRSQILEDTLHQFSDASAVVTDRFHGTIFSIVTRRPCVVLPTVDHKLTSGIAWFEEIPWVTMVESLAEVPTALERVRNVERIDPPDWRDRYFDPLAASVRKWINEYPQSASVSKD